MPAPLTPLQSAADEAIRSWPDARAKGVFGHRGFVRNGKMFAFFAHEGVAFKAAAEVDAEVLYDSGLAMPFVYNGTMEMRGWPVIPLTTDDHLSPALTAVRAAYEHVG